MKETHQKGNVGELRVAFESAKRGYVVSIPIGHDARYDLLIERDKKIERVQVKTVASDKEVVKVLLRSTGKKDGKNITKPYTPEEVDWIIVYDITTDLCAYVPSCLINERCHTLTLRYSIAKNNQIKGINWFKDYLEW